MERREQEINIDHLRSAAAQAADRGQVIESFMFDEVSLVPGGTLEMGPIYDIKYKDDPAHAAFFGHDLRSK